MKDLDDLDLLLIFTMLVAFVGLVMIALLV